jgi:hypothetical protein
MRVAIPVPALTSTLEQVGVPNASSIAPVVTIPLVRAADLQKAQQAYAVADVVGPWAPWGVAVLALLSIALARRWRTATTIIALGWIVLSFGLALVVMVAREPLMRRVDPAVARTIADAVGVGVVMLLVTGLSLAVRRRRR